ncbi:MAG: hypothetical protein ACRES2_04005, partial [Steroidobacteraceae bacterium]
IDPLHYRGEDAIDNPDVERFLQLGISRDQIGPMGELVLFDDRNAEHKNFTYLLVSYAWPRRAQEAGATRVVRPPSNVPGDNPAMDLAVIEKYFPDAFTVAEQQAGLPWVLLARDGTVQLTGRSPAAFNNSGVTQAYIEALLPGAKIEGYLGTQVTNAAGKCATAQFLWLAPDSPVTRSAGANLSDRKDVFLYTEVTWPPGAESPTTEDPRQQPAGTHFTMMERGRRTSETWLSVAFGKPGEDGLPGVLRWRVTTNDIGQGNVSVRLEIKSLGAASQWASAGPEQQVANGASANYQWTDSAGQIWKFAITPAMLNLPVH